MSDLEGRSNPITSTCNRPSSGDLPTIAYETQSGERRRVRYERTEQKPWNVERHVDRPDGEGGWTPCGGEQLTELVIDDEHRAAVTVTEGP